MTRVQYHLTPSSRQLDRKQTSRNVKKQERAWSDFLASLANSMTALKRSGHVRDPIGRIFGKPTMCTQV